jgi:glucose-6-phosphate isomerase
MKDIRFDFNNMFSHSVGRKDGVTDAEYGRISARALAGLDHIERLLADRESRLSIGLEWAMLPFQDKAFVRRVQRLGDSIAAKYDNVISLGIGGSYLGLKAAQDALCGAYYNEFEKVRLSRPRIYFDGNNMDPDTLGALIRNLDPKRTFVVVISKSGETTETKAAFAMVEAWLRKGAGARYGRQIFAITDPSSGALRKRVEAESRSDRGSFRSLEVMKGVGGRFSELNIGLLHMAIVGIDIQEVLDGAAAMSGRCRSRSRLRNPALAYAALHTILYARRSKSIAVLMPFSERLKSTSDWYVQLLAESLGKKYSRKVVRSGAGPEKWLNDTDSVVNRGRTPIPSRGTNDLHSIQQNNIEGERNKVVTFIKVDKFENDLTIAAGDILSGRRYSGLLSLAEEATEWALVREGRPSCTITMPELTARHWGGLIFFFEMATAIEGELLGVNAFDQPGVEGYKNYMYYKLGKKGIDPAAVEDIQRHPLVKKKKYII